tara:strand:- start:472 stop:660 length:189 start_codon:yes stop_codon:yes gene_type:complete
MKPITMYKLERTGEIADILKRMSDDLDGADMLDLCVIKAAITALVDELHEISTEHLKEYEAW